MKADSFNFLYQITSLDRSRAIYYGVSDKGTTLTAEDLNSGSEAICRGSYAVTDENEHVEVVPCEILAGESYTLWVGLDSDGTGNNLQLVTAGTDFDVAQASVESTVSVQLRNVETTGFELIYQITGHTNSGNLYWAVSNTGVTLSPEDTRSGNNAVCSGNYPQIDELQHTVDVACNLAAGQTYSLWLAVDGDGQGAGLTGAGATQFSVAQAAPTQVFVSLSNIVTSGFDMSYQIMNMKAGGKMYWSVVPYGTTVTADQVASGSGAVCSGSFNQQDANQHTETISSCTMQAGAQYNLMLAADSDGNLGGLALAAAGVPFAVPNDVVITTVQITLANVIQSGFDLSYQIDSPILGGKVYWAVGTGSGMTAEDVMNGNGAVCSGSYPQADEQTHTEHISCDLSGSGPFRFYVALDSNGNGANLQMSDNGQVMTVAAAATTTAAPLTTVASTAAATTAAATTVAATTAAATTSGSGSTQNPHCNDATDCSGNGSSSWYAITESCTCTCNSGWNGAKCDSQQQTVHLAITINGDVTTNGYQWSYQVQNPLVGGKIYWVTTPHEVTGLTAEDVIAQSNTVGDGCHGVETQADELEHDVIVSCSLMQGGRYKLWIAVDDDGNKGNLQLITPYGQDLLVSVTNPTMVINVDPNSILPSGFSWDYTVTNHIDWGKIYWVVLQEPQTLTGTEIREMSQDPANCGNAVFQVDDLKHTVQVTCPLDASLSPYGLWVAMDLDGNGYMIQKWLTPGNGGLISLGNGGGEVTTVQPVTTDGTESTNNVEGQLYYRMAVRHHKAEDNRLWFYNVNSISACALRVAQSHMCTDVFQWSAVQGTCACVHALGKLDMEPQCGTFIYHLFLGRAGFEWEEPDFEFDELHPMTPGQVGPNGHAHPGEQFEHEFEFELELEFAEVEFEVECYGVEFDEEMGIGMLPGVFGNRGQANQGGFNFEHQGEIDDYENGRHAFNIHHDDFEHDIEHGDVEGHERKGGRSASFDVEFDEDNWAGAELMLPGRIVLTMDEEQSNAEEAVFNFQLRHGYSGVKVDWVITSEMHLTMPDIRLGRKAACASGCTGSVELGDFNSHTLRIPLSLPNGHYGLWAVGQGRSTEYAQQLILSLPYGLYWNVGLANVEFSFLFAGMACEDEEETYRLAFAANAEDCAYIASGNNACGTMFLFNALTHICSCKPSVILMCDFEESPGSNVYRVDVVGGQTTQHLDKEWTFPWERPAKATAQSPQLKKTHNSEPATRDYRYLFVGVFCVSFVLMALVALRSKINVNPYAVEDVYSLHENLATV